LFSRLHTQCLLYWVWFVWLKLSFLAAVFFLVFDLFYVGFGFVVLFFHFFCSCFFLNEIWMCIYGVETLIIYLVKGLGEADHGVWD
jgi:hypothetical protein